MRHVQIMDSPKLARFTGISGDALLRTPFGARRADNIRPGDLVVTRGGGLRPVRLVWTRSIGEAEMKADPDLAPVRLAPRALGPMMPQKPLTLAPDHKVLVPGWLLEDGEESGGLIEARGLAGSSDAIWLDRDAAGSIFYNFVFDRHEVVMVSGLPVETFHPSAATVANVDEGTKVDLMRRFPALRREAEAFPQAALPVLPPAAYLQAMR
ncbi:Hint domain-containing protein [Profundibacterium mesophilum]|uniref:Hint domain protein n=1 Tax=Profundibacterium mesophilum KAUST100406-0324 TaxID=1037889 RepID=A0A921TE15_9RHOB|nr:Hint domain-containing protein [Profundibacterium mesophilum]KAF0676827.1 Hint domain protein [Profundibacterium mesophilum KAUST100406-0324]